MMSGLKTSPISPAGLPVITTACVYATFLLFPGPRSPSHSWAAGGGFYSSDAKGTITGLPLPLHSQKHTWFCTWTLIQSELLTVPALPRQISLPDIFALLFPLSRVDIDRNDPHTYHSGG